MTENEILQEDLDRQMAEAKAEFKQLDRNDPRAVELYYKIIPEIQRQINLALAAAHAAT